MREPFYLIAALPSHRTLTTLPFYDGMQKWTLRKQRYPSMDGEQISSCALLLHAAMAAEGSYGRVGVVRGLEVICDLCAIERRVMAFLSLCDKSDS